jgi:5-methylthioadenosine/S-adenosylhomocysteine deaminase
MSLLIRNVAIADERDRGSGTVRVDIHLRDGTIAAIGPSLAIAPDQVERVIDAEGWLAVPGLINAHLHSPGNLMRGMLDNLPLEIFMLYEVPPLSAGVPLARLNYVRTMLGAIEMLKLGITAVMDDAFHVPVATAEGIDAIAQAYLDSGMRARVAIDQPNVVEYDKYPFLRELLPDDLRRDMERAPRQTDAELLALYDHLIGRWNGAGDGRIGAALSCSAPHRVTKPYLHALSRLSARHDLPFNIHILETKLQRVFGEEKLGKSLVRYAHDEGVLDERTLVMHAIWIDDADIALLAGSGATVAHNPICNLRLGSGIMPFRKLRDAGVPICIGTDEATVDDTHNLWAAIKQAALIHTLTDVDYRRWPTAPEILDCARAGAARALRWPRLGSLEVGQAADIALVDLDTLAFTPLNDLARQLVYCENGGSVRMTIVAGKVVVEDGRVLTVDEAAIKREARALMADYRRETAEAGHAARRLETHYREMYLRAHARDVGLRRRLDP